MIKGKITVKHYLNKRLKPEIRDNKAKAYPVYVTITFNRKFVDFKSEQFSNYLIELTGNSYVTEKEFNSFAKELADEKAELLLIVDTFRLKDINILEFQMQPIFSLCRMSTEQVILDYWKNDLWNFITHYLDKDKKISRVINWSGCDFKEIYSALTYWGIFKSEIESSYSKHYKLFTDAKALKEIANFTPRLYHFAVETRRNPLKYKDYYPLILPAVNNYLLLINARLGKVLVASEDLN